MNCAELSCLATCRGARAQCHCPGQGRGRGTRKGLQGGGLGGMERVRDSQAALWGNVRRVCHMTTDELDGVWGRGSVFSEAPYLKPIGSQKAFA